MEMTELQTESYRLTKDMIAIPSVNGTSGEKDIGIYIEQYLLCPYLFGACFFAIFIGGRDCFFIEVKLFAVLFFYYCIQFHENLLFIK